MPTFPLPKISFQQFDGLHCECGYGHELKASCDEYWKLISTFAFLKIGPNVYVRNADCFQQIYPCREEILWKNNRYKVVYLRPSLEPSTNGSPQP